MDVLPAVPDDTSFLEMLKVGGILKPDKVDVIAAMRAGLANRVDLYDLPDTLVKKMESYAESVDEPCSEAFFEMLKVATARGYGDVLSALGVSGTFASEARKNKLLAKIDDTLWESFSDFHAQLKAWQEAWMSGAANPAMMSMAMAAMMGGGQLPPGMMAPPDASPVRDKAEAVINAINKVFSGPGIPVARALAYDALRIKSLLEDPRLPAQIGAANRDQMLKALGVSVTADYVRLERNVVKYALAIMELPNIASGNSEVIYLGALLQLGLSIPWAILLRSEGSGGKGKKQF